MHNTSFMIRSKAKQSYSLTKNNHYTPFQHRCLSNSSINSINFANLTDIQYNTAADNTMDRILDSLESLNDTTSIKDYDVQYNVQYL